MARISSIELLPDDLRVEALERLDSKKYTHNDVKDWVNAELAKRWAEYLKYLSDDELKNLDEWLLSPYMHPKEVAKNVNEIIRSKGFEPCALLVISISKTALNDFYLKKVKDRQKHSEALEYAAMVNEMAEKNHAGDLGKALTEITKKFSVLLSRDVDFENLAFAEKLKLLGALSNISQRLARASKYDSDRIIQEADIRANEREVIKDEINQTVKAAGITKDMGDALLEALGVYVNEQEEA